MPNVFINSRIVLNANHTSTIIDKGVVDTKFANT